MLLNIFSQVPQLGEKVYPPPPPQNISTKIYHITIQSMFMLYLTIHSLKHKRTFSLSSGIIDMVRLGLILFGLVWFGFVFCFCLCFLFIYLFFLFFLGGGFCFVLFRLVWFGLVCFALLCFVIVLFFLFPFFVLYL